jgi:hypothetical protein
MSSTQKLIGRVERLKSISSPLRVDRSNETPEQCYFRMINETPNIKHTNTLSKYTPEEAYQRMLGNVI